MSSVLITGGTGVVGKELVKGFNSKGWDVYFTATSEESIDRFLNDLEHNDNCVGLVAKLDDKKSLLEFSKKIKKLNITCLINNARNISSLNTVEGETQIEDFEKEFFMANITPYVLTNALIESLTTVINISSMYGVVPPNKSLYEGSYENSPIQYGVSKAAENFLTKELAVRLADKNIRVNALSYGGIEGRVDESFKKRYATLCPLKEMLKTNELFPHAFYLASNASSGMTGQNLIVDGGWSVW